MIRVGVLLVLFVIGRTNAQTLAGGGLDRDGLIALYAEALTFIAPRIIDPVPVSRLAILGLQGLTTLDPDLRIVATDASLKLLSQDGVVHDLPAPKDELPVSWAKAGVALTAASLPVSALVRRAGTPGIVRSFFAQMFSQLDPYSRYMPPAEAIEDRAKRAGRVGLGLTVGQRGVLIEVKSVVRDSPLPSPGSGQAISSPVSTASGRRTRTLR